MNPLPDSKAESATEEREQAEAHAEMYRERLLSIQLGLWNTQAAISALFISAASVMATFGEVPRYALLGIIVLASVSLLLVQLNYRSARDRYRFLGSPPPKDIWTNQESRTRYTQFASSEMAKFFASQQSCQKRESACDWLLFVCVLLLALSVYSASHRS